jgi:hypothetical protein
MLTAKNLAENNRPVRDKKRSEPAQDLHLESFNIDFHQVNAFIADERH